MSKKFTAWNTQIIIPVEKRVIRKKTKQSDNNFLNNIFFIEIYQNNTYIFSTISLQFKYNLKYIFIKNVNKNEHKKQNYLKIINNHVY